MFILVLGQKASVCSRISIEMVLTARIATVVIHVFPNPSMSANRQPRNLVLFRDFIMAATPVTYHGFRVAYTRQKRDRIYR